jgi:hypothetical protein
MEPLGRRSNRKKKHQESAKTILLDRGRKKVPEMFRP